MPFEPWQVILTCSVVQLALSCAAVAGYSAMWTLDRHMVEVLERVVAEASIIKEMAHDIQANAALIRADLAAGGDDDA